MDSKKYILFDLKKLKLKGGIHRITVVARATGYRDSEPSNEILYIASYSLKWKIIVLPSFIGDCEVFCKIDERPSNANDFDICIKSADKNQDPEISDEKLRKSIQKVYLWYKGKTQPVAFLNENSEYILPQGFKNSVEIVLQEDSVIELTQHKRV